MITALQSPEGDVRIMEGSAVRMRIVGFRVDQREMVRVFFLAFRRSAKGKNVSLCLQFCVGSLKDDYLGLIPT
jgi:hypothetical protein